MSKHKEKQGKPLASLYVLRKILKLAGKREASMLHYVYYCIGGLSMGVYSDYLNQQLSFEELTNERKAQLKRISEIRGRGVLVFASDVAKNCPNSIDYSDIVPFSDQLSVISGNEIDIILETPGGLAEVVEDLVKLIRSQFNKVGIIVPGMAKSAGTIFTMAADEILMGKTSALGPIDA